jgi:FkbM family methyltransferase
MKRVLIDFGAGTGDDIKGFYNLDPKNKTAEVHAFEANPVRISKLKDRYPNVNIYNAGVGTQNTRMKLYLGNTLNTSSFLESKKSITTERFHEVEVIDICQWMKDNFNSSDHITMVIDIEGAEYDVLEAMEDQGLWNWISEFYVEFHGTKLEGFDMTRETNLVNRLVDRFDDKVYICNYHNHKQFCKLNSEAKG